MDANPYAPPAATVADIPETSAADEAAAPFFAVSITKLVVLHFCTLGLYPVFWFYAHWRKVRDRSGERMMPVWRGLFAVFFCYPLFKKIRDAQSEPFGKLAAGPLATCWIVLTMLSRLPAPYWLIALLSVLPMIPVQNAANDLNRSASPNHDPNSTFSAWNWVVTVLGGLLFLLALIGTFVPEGL